MFRKQKLGQKYVNSQTFLLKFNSWVFITSQLFGYFPLSILRDPSFETQSLESTPTFHSLPFILCWTNILGIIAWLGGFTVIMLEPHDEITHESETDEFGYILWSIVGTTAILSVRIFRLTNRNKFLTFWACVIHLNRKLKATFPEIWATVLLPSMMDISNFFFNQIFPYLVAVTGIVVMNLVRIFFFPDQVYYAPVHTELIISIWDFFIFFHIIHTFVPLYFVKLLTAYFSALHRLLGIKGVQNNSLSLPQDKIFVETIHLDPKELTMILSFLAMLEELVTQFNVLYSVDILSIVGLSGMQVLAGFYILFTRKLLYYVVVNYMGFILLYSIVIWNFCIFGAALTNSALECLKQIENVSSDNFSDAEQFKVWILSLFCCKLWKY